MFEEILQGRLPTEVMEEILRSNDAVDLGDVAWHFHQEFPKLSSSIVQIICNWRRPGDIFGLSAMDLDKTIIYYLRKSGYIGDVFPKEYYVEGGW